MKGGFWCLAAEAQHRVLPHTTDGNGLNGARSGNSLLLRRGFLELLRHTLNKLV
jgi:hypothetical protein